MFKASKIKKYRFWILFIGAIIVSAMDIVGFMFFSSHDIFYFFIAAIELFLAIMIALIIFHIDDQKTQKMEEQLKELTDSYEYIGILNRQISTLTESTNLISSQHSLKESTNLILDTILNTLKGELAFLFYWSEKNIIRKHFRSLTRDEQLAKQGYTIYKNFQKLPDFCLHPENKNQILEIKNLSEISPMFNNEIFKNSLAVILPISLKGETVGCVFVLYKYKKISQLEKDILKPLATKLGIINNIFS